MRRPGRAPPPRARPHRPSAGMAARSTSPQMRAAPTPGAVVHGTRSACHVAAVRAAMEERRPRPAAARRPQSARFRGRGSCRSRPTGSPAPAYSPGARPPVPAPASPVRGSAGPARRSPDSASAMISGSNRQIQSAEQLGDDGQVCGGGRSDLECHGDHRPADRWPPRYARSRSRATGMFSRPKPKRMCRGSS